MKGTNLFKISFTLIIIAIIFAHFWVKKTNLEQYVETRKYTFTRYIEDDIHELISIIHSKKRLLYSLTDHSIYSVNDITLGTAEFNRSLSLLIKNNDHISSVKVYSDQNRIRTYYKKNDKIYISTDTINFKNERQKQILTFNIEQQNTVNNEENSLIWDKPAINSFDKFISFNAYLFEESYFIVAKSDISSINSSYLFNGNNDYYRFLVDSLGNPISKNKMGFYTGLNRSQVPIEILPTDTFNMDSDIDKPTFNNHFETIIRKEGNYAAKLVCLNKINMDPMYLLFMIPYSHLNLHASSNNNLFILELLLPFLLLALTVLYFLTHQITRNPRLINTLNSSATKIYQTLKVPNNRSSSKNNNENLFEDEDISNIKQKVQKMISDKLFLQTHFTIDTCASELQLEKQLLSQYIQLTYNCSYRMFINKLRINEALRIMQRDPQFVDKYSFEHLGEMVGFNSRTSFYRAFKYHAGCSPTEYSKGKTDGI